jgi:lysozyme
MMDLERVISGLKSDEGFKACGYLDSEGFLTVGYGTLIDEKKGGGITQDEAEMLLRNRLATRLSRLDYLRPGWRSMKGRVPDAIANMAYQIGPDGLHGFNKMWNALADGDFKAAAAEALDSKWAMQTPNRAARIAAMMENV